MVVKVKDLEPTAPSDHVTVTVSVFIVGVMAGVGVTVSARVKVTGPWVTLTLPDRQVLEPAPALVKPTRRFSSKQDCAIAVAVVMFLLPKLPRTTPVVRTAVPINPTVSNTIEIKISIRVKPFWLLTVLDADELSISFAIS
jgi:hypothetical protein